MPTLRDISTRITSTQKMQKIVKAMKMVAAAKLARATQAINAARPYAEKLTDVLGAVAEGVESDAHPLLARREVRRLDVVLFTSDRGLCGAYNSGLIKHAERLIVARRTDLESVTIVPVGARGEEHFERRELGEIQKRWTGLPTITPEYAAEIAEFLSKRYESGETDEVVLVYSTFASALSQTPGDEVLLPLQPPSKADTADAGAPRTYEVEPDPVKLLALFGPRAVNFRIFRALLENQAGEHGARMTAMENATSNTEELIRSLKLEFNKARQASITQELMEIVSGAEAL